MQREFLARVAEHGLGVVRGWVFSAAALPASDCEMIERLLVDCRNACARCGQPGHFVRECMAAPCSCAQVGRPSMAMTYDELLRCADGGEYDAGGLDVYNRDFLKGDRPNKKATVGRKAVECIRGLEAAQRRALQARASLHRFLKTTQESLAELVRRIGSQPRWLTANRSAYCDLLHDEDDAAYLQLRAASALAGCLPPATASSAGGSPPRAMRSGQRYPEVGDLGTVTRTWTTQKHHGGKTMAIKWDAACIAANFPKKAIEVEVVER